MSKSSDPLRSGSGTTAGGTFRPLLGVVAAVVVVLAVVGALLPGRSTPPAPATAGTTAATSTSISATLVAPVGATAAPKTATDTLPPTPVRAPAPPGNPASQPPAITPVQAKAAMKIQQVKSPGGIEAWLVEEHSVPLLAMRYVFDGGNSQDPAGKEGIANFLTAMLDEGAGELTAEQFQERMEELAARISFEDSRDSFYGNFETLTVNRAGSVELLRLALTKPRFEADAVERIRKQLLAGLAFSAKSPDKVAGKAWAANAFPNHPYGRPADGTAESINSIAREDLEAFRRRIFARNTLRVVAVGDIDAATLSKLLDEVFGDLPAKSDLVAVAATEPKPIEKLKVIEMDVPQSVVQFGSKGIDRKDPDFMAAFILNQILGGGGFASRLTEEVREKRGLAYSVYSYIQPFRHVSIFGGGVATKNEEVARSLDVIRGELKRMADDGPTAEELVNAKSYLTGSFALRFDTNAKIANQLIWMLQEDMGIDYVQRRNALVEAVTLDELKRVAKRLLTVDDLIVTVVGKPQGLASGK
jgi:zinc protease